MMRNYSKAISSGVIALTVLASGMLASAQNDSEWRALRDGYVSPAKEKPHKSRRQIVRESLGLRSTGTAIAASKDGVRPTPKISQRPSNLLRSPENPRGNLYGVINRFPEMVYNYEAFVARLNPATGEMTKLYDGYQFCPYAGEDYVFQTNAYCNGAIYSPASAAGVGESGQYWTVTDFYTGELTQQIPFNAAATPYSLCYNSDDGKFYAVGIDDMTSRASVLMVIDPKDSYKAIELADLGHDFNTGFVAAIAYNSSDKTLYLFNARNDIYTVEGIDTGDLKIVEAGYVDTTDLIFQEGVTSPLTYSPADQMFLTIYRDNSIKANRLIYIHPETGEVFEGPIMAEKERPYIASIFVTDEYAEPDAPETVGKVDISFPESSLSGQINFEAPKYTYAGVELGSTKVKLVVKVDGKTIYEENVSAGQQISLKPTFEEGYHTMEIISYNGELASPARTIQFYTGFDAPRAPANVALKGTELSWEKPGKVGKHDGFVDVDDITYNVYLDGKKQNDAPLTATSFSLTAPEVQKVCRLEVEAISHGHASDKGGISEVFGKPIALPFLQKPERTEKDMYRTINHNNDERVWFWTDESATTGADMYGWAMSVGYINAADDWLIFPLISFPEADKLYSLDFDIAGMMVGMTTCESYEIYIAKEPTVKAMLEGTLIYKDNYYMTDDTFQHKSYNFAVKEPGDYYIAIRINSTKDTNPSGMGLLLNDFNVKVADGKTPAVPADPTDVVIIPDAEGLNEFELQATLPTLDIVGKQLDPSQNITLSVGVEDRVESVSGKPGERVSVMHGVSAPGFTNVAITPSNANGKGYTRYVRHYIGVDIPLCPTDIKATASADNLTLHYTWKAPGNVGENNGVVIPEEIEYKFYTVIGGITFSYIDKTTECKYDFKPYGDEARAQTTYLSGPSACNMTGESKNSIFYQDEVGVPFELPVKEEFGTTKFDFGPYRYLTEGDFKQSMFNNVGSLEGMGLGDPRFIQGGIMAYCTGYTSDCRFVLPKVTTSGIARSVFNVRVWDYKEAPECIQIFGRRYGKEEETFLGEYRFTHPDTGEWVDYEVPLPDDYNNCPWVQIRFGGPLRGGEKYQNEYLIVDSYSFFPDLNNDLKITGLDGLTVATPGETAKYNVTVANSGRERSEGTLVIEAKGEDGKVIASSETKIPMLNSNQFFEYEAEFELNGAFANSKTIDIIATISESDDNINNNVRSLKLEMKDSAMPVVSDLEGKPQDDAVALTWSAPQNQYGDFENFEFATPYEVADHIGRFQNIDLDKQPPVAIGNGSLEIKWEGYGKPQAWTVLDMEDLKLMNDSRLAPHSGKQVIIARSPWFEQDAEPKQASKWLISPEVEPGSRISFWISTPSSGDVEYLEIWTSETGTTLDPDKATSTRNGNFRKQKPLSKSGSEAWEYVTYKLPAKAKYFALRYCSYDGLAMLLDDISFTPAEKLSYDISHYSVYRSDDNGEPILLSDNLTAPGFVDKTWDNTKSATYYVLAHANYDGKVLAGAKSNLVRIQATGVDNIDDNRSITGLRGEIRVDGFQGEEIIIASADGKVMANGIVRAQQAHYAVAPGIYAVTCGKTVVKVIVK